MLRKRCSYKIFNSRSTALYKYHVVEIYYNKWIFTVSLNLTDYFWTSPNKNSLLYPALCKIHLTFIARNIFKSLEIYTVLCLLASIQIYAFRNIPKFPQPLKQLWIWTVKFIATVVLRIQSSKFCAAAWGLGHCTLTQISCLHTSHLLLLPKNTDLLSEFGTNIP